MVLLVSVGDCSLASQTGRRELCDEPAALSPDGASRSAGAMAGGYGGGLHQPPTVSPDPLA